MSAADLNLQLVLELVDRATAPARAAIAAVRRAGAAVQRAGRGTIDWSNKQLSAISANRAAMQAQVVDTAALGVSLYALTKPAVEFEVAMAGVKKVIDFEEPEALKLLGDDILDLISGGKIPMAAEGIAAIIEAAGQAGIVAAELGDAEKRQALIDFAADAARMGVAFDVSAEQAGNAMVMWRSRLKPTQPDVLKMGDAVNHLSNNMDATAAAILTVINRQGAVAQSSGLMREEIAALSAAFVAAAPSPEIAATGMKNFLSTLTKGAAVTDAEKTVLDQLGLDAEELARKMQVDAKGAIIEVMEALAELPQHAQAAALSRLFGEESIGAITPLLTNLEMLRGSFELVADAEAFAGSMLREYESQASTTNAQLIRMRGFAKALSVTIGSAVLPELNALLDTLMPLIGAARDWAAAHPELITLAFKLAAALLVLRVATLAARWAFYAAAVPVLHLVRAGGWLLVMLPRLAGAMLGLLNPLTLIRAAALALRTALLFSGVGAVIAGLAMGGLWIFNNWAGLKAFFAGFGEGLRAALGPAAQLLEAILAKGRATRDWLREITGPLDLTAEAWREMGERAGASLGGIIARISEWTGANPAFLAGIAKLTAGLVLLRAVLNLPARLVFGSFRLLGRAARAAIWPIRGLIRIIARLAGLAPIRWARLIPKIGWVPLAGKLAWGTLVAGLRWFLFIPLIRWVALAGKLAWGKLVPVLRWTRFVKLIGWAALAGKLAWSALLPLLSWVAFIPGIGWALLAGVLAWTLLIKSKLPWRDFIPEIDWGYWFSFRWVDKLPAWNWSEIIPPLNLGRFVPPHLRGVTPGGAPSSKPPVGPDAGATGPMRPPHLDAPVQARALGGSFAPGWLLTGENGPEMEFRSHAGFIAHNRALRTVLATSESARRNVAAARAGLPAIAAAAAPLFHLTAKQMPLKLPPTAVERRAPIRLDTRAALRGPGAQRGDGGTVQATIHIHQAPGQDPKALAEQVMRKLKRLQTRASRGAELHDGGDFDAA
ncbi:MAG: phage tail tape measure protein [Rhodobacter sp.]|nr:phage tail tape measure protein [Rhodobacter sp.]